MALEPIRSTESLLEALERQGPLPAGAWVASDADGTLWAADVAECAWNLALAEGAFRPEAGPPLAEILRAAGGEASGEPHRDAREIWRRFLAGAIADGPILQAMAVCFAGLSEVEAAAFADRVYREHLAPRVYESTLPLFQALAARGLRLVVVSGSPSFLVAGALRGLGLAGEVRAVTLRVEAGRLCGEVVPPLTWNAGKVEAIGPLVGPGGPLIALGDSPGDRELLLASRHKILVHPRAALRREANQGTGWHLFCPPRTVAGQLVAQPTQDAWG